MRFKDFARKASEVSGEIRDSNLTGAIRFVRALPGFFRHRIEPERARAEIQRRLETREERFLELARSFVYEKPTSPYLRLLENAGCELTDLRAEVGRHGIEGALARLAKEGVYLTAEEFKGKRPVVRGRETFLVSPRDFECAPASAGYATQSSGTRNLPLRTFTPLDWLAARSLSTCVFFRAHDLFDCVHAVYDTILPGSAGINQVLIYARAGVATEQWFAREIAFTLPEAAYARTITYAVLLMGRLFGPGSPVLRFIGVDDIDTIIDWVEVNRRRGDRSCITTAASNAARIARRASERDVSLRGLRFVVSGEPFTESKRVAVETAGATATVRCTYGGSVNIGFGCANPIHVDEVHVNQHILALTRHTRPIQGNVDIQPLLCTTLEPSAPRVLLNVESGDYAEMSERNCGCSLEQSGLRLHLHHMRSFEKFTSEGMNYFFSDLFEIVESTLPNEFGGGLGDYQIVEEEDETGQSRLTLLVHPRLSIRDEGRVLSRFTEILSRGSPGNRVMSELWKTSGTFGIRREPPRASPRGKILPLQFCQRNGG